MCSWTIYDVNEMNVARDEQQKMIDVYMWNQGRIQK